MQQQAYAAVNKRLEEEVLQGTHHVHQQLCRYFRHPVPNFGIFGLQALVKLILLSRVDLILRFGFAGNQDGSCAAGGREVWITSRLCTYIAGMILRNGWETKME